MRVERARTPVGACAPPLLAVVALIAAVFAARAQNAAAPSAAPATAPPAAAAPEPTTDSETRLAPVEITGSRPDDVQERRDSTAAKIIIGREEIDRFGDSTLGDVLKRLPGVTIQGRPGRGGAIRLRGLGSGYTQILLDGERVPPGFSLDSLTPDQIERIEILRAPTAETGARAIAGTINIVTRGGYSRRVNDVRLTAGYENGHLQPSASWSRNFSDGAFIVNYSLSAFAYDRDSSSTNTTVDQRLDDGTVTLAQVDEGRLRVRGGGVNATARIQWRSDDGVDSATLTPIAFVHDFRSERQGTLTQSVGVTPPPYDQAFTNATTGNSLVRLNSEWTHRLAPTSRTELRLGIGQARLPVHAFRTEFTGASESRTLEDTSDSHDTTITANGKWIATILEEHSLVSGLEGESNRRTDTRISLQDGQPYLNDFGDDVNASVVRVAAYVQDEWKVSDQWAAHAGVRWEGIRTRGSTTLGEPDATNRSSVWTPLLHAVWKPEPTARDQVRISLTRSYRAPPLVSLIARPTVNPRYPVPGPNTPTHPDRAGNPELQPELATGVDVALERYLPGSGLISANVFWRYLTNYMRGVTTLQTVSYSNVPRYVLTPQNVGDATTGGLELETKFRASDLWASAPRIDVRANASFFHSQVKSVPGPDNRLDQQPDYTANVGADYRFAGMPLTVGGNVNWTPGYLTRISDVQTASIGRKVVLDAYGVWTFTSALALRLSLSNIDPRVYVVGSSFEGPNLQNVPVLETSQTTAPTFINVQLRLEMKL